MSEKKKTILAFLLIFCSFYFFNYLTPLYADDYGYCFSISTGKRINSVSDIFISQCAHYTKINGRFIAHFIAQFFLYMGKPIYNVFNTVAMGGLIYLMAKHIDIGKISFKYVIGIWMMLFLLVPMFGESFLWLVASTTYLLGPLCVLTFLYPYRLSAENKTLNNNPFMPLFMLLAGIIAGAISENSSAMSIVLCVYLIIIQFKNIKTWMLIGLCGNIIGAISLIVSPGEKARMDEYGGFDITVIGYRFISITSSLLGYFWIILLIMLVISLYLIKKNGFKLFCIENKLSLVYFVGFLAGTYSMILSPIFPSRAWSAPSICLILSFTKLYKCFGDMCYLQYNKKYMKVIKSIKLTAIVAFLVLFCFASVDLYNVYNSYKKREEVIFSQISDGNTIIEVPAIIGNTSYSNMFTKPDLSEGNDEWPNDSMAAYYGVEYIRRNDDISLR